MIRKIQSIQLYWFHACLNKLTWCLVQNMIKHYLRSQMSLGLNLWFKMAQTHLVVVALAQHTHIAMSLSCIIIVALHLLCSSLFDGICPLLVDVVPTASSMTPMKNYTIFRSAKQAKPPCSFRYNPTLSLLLSFTALGQQRFNCYMLRSWTLFLCMTCHCHSK